MNTFLRALLHLVFVLFDSAVAALFWNLYLANKFSAPHFDYPVFAISLMLLDMVRDWDGFRASSKDFNIND